MNRKLAHAFLALSGLGGALSLYLTYIHYRLQREPHWQSICSINDLVDCDAVILSPYGWIAGLPLAIWGAWFYTVNSLVVALELRRRDGLGLVRSAPAFILVASAVGGAVSVALAVLSLGSVGALCLLCVGLYVINFALFAVAWLGVRSTGESVVDALRAEGSHLARHWLRNAVVSVGAVAVLWLIHVAYSGGTVGGSNFCQALTAAVHASSGEPIEVRVYSDFQCEHCRALDRALRPLRSNRRLRLVQRQYPLDSECNPNVKAFGHSGACIQALGALCAEAQGPGLEFQDLLFDKSPRSQAALLVSAASTGLDVTTFEHCLVGSDARQRLRGSVEEAKNLGVRATPTIFLGGLKHIGQLGAADLRCLSTGTR